MSSSITSGDGPLAGFKELGCIARYNEYGEREKLIEENPKFKGPEAGAKVGPASLFGQTIGGFVIPWFPAVRVLMLYSEV
ncbi:hypothetical protein U1Q18_032764 [Sarracenia purpurea var. burkii]